MPYRVRRYPSLTESIDTQRQGQPGLETLTNLKTAHFKAYIPLGFF